ncbi:putative BspA family leucine-rich repeat surface protein [Vibrio crassostreae]|nr:putative BspA family leucine-rich repeat surface protein [Vibrio crassostreae]CAK3224724.1 putative BspA family leucine-rich repeat surface protein [Vibrio crassostreae]
MKMKNTKIALSIALLTFGTAQASNFVAFTSISEVTIEKNLCNNIDNHISLSALNTHIQNWNNNPSEENRKAISNACVDSITDFSKLFMNSSWDGDLSSWNVSNGVDFNNMFTLNHFFNQDISNWNVSKGVNFNEMFRYASSFNQDISKWDTDKSVSWYAFDVGSGFDVWNIPLKFR